MENILTYPGAMFPFPVDEVHAFVSVCTVTSILNTRKSNLLWGNLQQIFYSANTLENSVLG